VEKSFKSAIAFPAETPAQHEIVFRARYALGCFYYAKNRFADAQRYLQQIPPFSEIYYDAIVVIGWALFKSRLWGVCREVAEELRKSYNADIRAEGYLLEAYCVFGDTIAIPSRRERLSAVLAITTKARELLPELNAYRLLETDGEQNAIFEQQRQLAHYIGEFNESLDTTEKRAEQFKRINELKKPFKNISDNMTTGYYAISIAQHYQAIDDRLATIIDDIEYLHNKMRILVERPIPVQEEAPVEQAAERE
jgi:tetratricopeptide (TPR) repeat protein